MCRILLLSKHTKLLKEILRMNLIPAVFEDVKLFPKQYQKEQKSSLETSFKVLD